MILLQARSGISSKKEKIFFRMSGFFSSNMVERLFEEVPEILRSGCKNSSMPIENVFDADGKSIRPKWQILLI